MVRCLLDEEILAAHGLLAGIEIITCPYLEASVRLSTDRINRKRS